MKWKTHNEKYIKKVISKSSCLLDGGPGCGKSHELINNIVEGEDLVLCPTNAAV